MTGKKNANGWGNVRRQALGLLASGVFGMSLISLGTGCASKPKPEPQVRHEGTLNPPVVISGKPARDTRALLQADDQLTEADWKVLEKLGPRPIWEQIDNRSKRSRE